MPFHIILRPYVAKLVINYIHLVLCDLLHRGDFFRSLVLVLDPDIILFTYFSLLFPVNQFHTCFLQLPGPEARPVFANLSWNLE